MKQEISTSMIESVGLRLAENKQVRRALPQSGRLHVDRQLPFLFVYRRPADHDDKGTDRLVSGEASYLIAPGETRYRRAISGLVSEVVRTLSAEFGAFLIIEVWAGPEEVGPPPKTGAVPHNFTIHVAKTNALARTVEALGKQLERIRVQKRNVSVETVYDGKCHPPGLAPLMTAGELRELNCSVIGVTIPPVYRSPSVREPGTSAGEAGPPNGRAGEVYPLLLRSLRRRVGLALRQGVFEFSRSRTTHRPGHYHALGRRAVVKAVWEVDKKLATVSDQFDYLVLLTPVNARHAWSAFRRSRCEQAPTFRYQPMPIDPAALKRRLYAIPVERVEDPALQRLFNEKREEVELKLTMLRDRDTRRFLYESLQLFGGVGDDLLGLATALLDTVSTRAGREKGDKVDATGFAERAEAEFAHYRRQFSGFRAKVRIGDDVSGLMVSRGTLLINPDMSLPESRVEALIAHEVGTHLVTYYNGKAQPFEQLYSGLAGYDELQEGLAVLAEYLVGGLTGGRLRQLAARVVAVRHMVDGATFVDTFRSLVRDHGFPQQAAYTITMRVYRGGGLTKDAAYLRGLDAVMGYVGRGGALDPLMVGKLAIDHIPIIKELQHREVLTPAPLRPKHLEDAVAVERLNDLRRNSAVVLDLVCGDPSKNTRAH